jgi:hypothetical protein
MPDTKQMNHIPLKVIISSIESEEWGDVRSYLDECDSDLWQFPSTDMETITEALDKQSHLVKFTRHADGDWSYEEL